MDAIVTAGGIPKPGEPLYEYTQGIYKALLDIAGKPMIQWVLDALCGRPHDQTECWSSACPLKDGVPITSWLAYLPNQGGMMANYPGWV